MAKKIQEYKVLIIEDEPALRMALKDKLGHAGFSVLDAQDGESGLELALQQHPDMILLDLLMPKLDGLGMLRKLRQDAWGKTSKVVILTNISDNDKLAEAMSEEAFDYLIKSDWKIEDVVKKVQEKLGIIQP